MTGPWDRFRENLQASMLASLPDHLARLTWDRDRIAQAQREGLRTLLRTAAAHSPFHQRRLAGIDLETIEPEDLSQLPVMTKSQMMADLDDVFTDRRLRVADIEAAIAVTHDQPVPILDTYVVLASGGSSGRRGVMVHNRESLCSFIAAATRPAIARWITSGVPLDEPATLALVTAPSAVHATGLLACVNAGDKGLRRIEAVPATLPMRDIVERLNAIQPQALTAYASMLASLAAEAREGRLKISPAEVSSTSETLLPEIRAAVHDAFGLAVFDGFGSTEGLVGITPTADDLLVFNTDMCIVELVDTNNQPVPQGVPSAKVLVTNLYNLTQPLIRYELNDVFIKAPDSPIHGHLRACANGRSDDILHYADTDVHPIVIRSVMVKSPEVVDYQIRQTLCGVEAVVVTSDSTAMEHLAAKLRGALIDAGLRCPAVEVRQVDQLERNSCGKLRRFVPIDA